ncbi:MAG: hypothetical protein SangKO_100060 [Sandaracinaceae bacterium]
MVVGVGLRSTELGGDGELAADTARVAEARQALDGLDFDRDAPRRVNREDAETARLSVTEGSRRLVPCDSGGSDPSGMNAGDVERCLRDPFE